MSLRKNPIDLNQPRTTKPEDIFRAAGYFFSFHIKQWKHGIIVVSREEPLIFLINFAKANHIREPGTWSEHVLARIETDPKNTFREFTKKHLVRDYNHRVSGIDMFREWLKTANLGLDSEEIKDLPRWMQKHSNLVHRFYDAAEQAGIKIKKQARSSPRVMLEAVDTMLVARSMKVHYG